MNSHTSIYESATKQKKSSKKKYYLINNILI